MAVLGYKMLETARRLSTLSDQEFFNAVAKELYDHCPSKLVIIGQIQPGDRVSSLAWTLQGELQQEMSYALSGTPCSNLISNPSCYYSEDIQNRFPEDEILKIFEVNSYLGFGVVHPRTQNAIGLVALLDEAPLELDEESDSYVQFLTTLIASRLFEVINLRDMQVVVNTNEIIIGAIGHDLKNPIANLLANTELLHAAREKSDFNIERCMEYVNRIRKQAQNINTQLNQLLSWSKENHIHTELSPQSVTQSEITDYVTTLFGVQFETKNISFHTSRCCDDLIPMDRYALHLVIRNLISNALKFTPSGGEVRLDFTMPEPNTLRISVTDSGVGMSEETLYLLLNSRGRIASLQGTEGELGNGLGFSLIKTVAESHSATINGESSLGKGTAIWMDIPLSNVQ